MNLKNKILLFFKQTYHKRKEFPYLKTLRDNDQKRKLLVWKHQVPLTGKEAYISNKVQLQNYSSVFFQSDKSLPSASSTLSRSPMAYNTTASVGKPICTDYVEFGKGQDRLGQNSWSKNHSIYLDAKFEFFQKDGNKSFLTGAKSDIGRGRFQPVLKIEETVGLCRKKVC